MSKKLILVCNAHLDPVWLWRWPEGLAETLSTFRIAAEFCESHSSFIFCHNESILYSWVEEYDPELFCRIRKLVAAGRWHIMGGWYVQPDCNLPSGESFVRQILSGKGYFMEKFGVEPRAAVNFDPFGHSRGLVQILKKSGYSSYLFCRPDVGSLDLPGEDFTWTGYDGSEIIAHRAVEHYNSQRGKAGEKLDLWLKRYGDKSSGLLLWGIGNHGGGPSREDLEALDSRMEEYHGTEIRHGTPEEYFDLLESERHGLPSWDKDLNPWAVGCYTSMSRIKTGHRELENQYFLAEKMAAHSAVSGLMPYPRRDFQEALESLLFSQFHDGLPGSSISEVETDLLQRLNHGMEILSRIKNRAFFSLLSGQEKAREGEFPILIYNPHSFFVDQIFACEFQPPEPNFDRTQFWNPEILDGEGHPVLFQLEKQSCNISVDHRKRVVFRTTLPPGQMTRLSCRLKAGAHPAKRERRDSGRIEVHSDKALWEIGADSGLLESFSYQGESLLEKNACRLLVIRDDADPWGMKVEAFRDILGEFHLMSPQRSAGFAGVDRKRLAPVRVIEDGPVRTVVEALFMFGRSEACVRYKFPKAGAEFELEIRVYWMEKDRMLKLSLPTGFPACECFGQTAYGVERFVSEGKEHAAQSWQLLRSDKKNLSLSVVNSGTYGFDFSEGEIRPSLLRSAAYAAHPVAEGIPLVPQDRFEPRIDQGERMFRFWITGGDADERREKIEREALVKNQPPKVLCCYPSGDGKPVLPLLVDFDSGMVSPAVKYAENNENIIIRLFEPTGRHRTVRLKFPVFSMKMEIDLSPFEIKTICLNPLDKTWKETDLLERPRTV